MLPLLVGLGFDILNVVLGKLKKGEDVLQEQDELVIGGSSARFWNKSVVVLATHCPGTTLAGRGTAVEGWTVHCKPGNMLSGRKRPRACSRNALGLDFAAVSMVRAVGSLGESVLKEQGKGRRCSKHLEGFDKRTYDR